MLSIHFAISLVILGTFHEAKFINSNNIARLVKKTLTSFVTATSIFGLPNVITPIKPAFSEVDTTYNNFIPRTADVGIREFIVIRGPQHIRLASPTVDTKTKKLLLGSKRVSDETQKIQENLELIRLRLEQVGLTNPMVWSNVQSEESQAEVLFKKNIPLFTELSVDPNQASTFITKTLIPDFNELKSYVQAKDGKQTFALSEQTAQDFFTLRKMQIPKNSVLPYKIPDDYNNLPYLNGYAEVEMKIASKKGFKVPDSYQVKPEETFILTVDGYHAPITAGNFIDLVDKKFYDNMNIQRAEEQLIQTGKPSKTVDGYIDPATGTVRTIPLELFYKKDYEPVYGITSDDDGRATDTMALPFQAYGTIGMARSNDEEDSATSQIFFLKWLQALNPPGTVIFLCLYITLANMYPKYIYLNHNIYP